jgi:hypothetical protein
MGDYKGLACSVQVISSDSVSVNLWANYGDLVRDKGSQSDLGVSPHLPQQLARRLCSPDSLVNRLWGQGGREHQVNDAGELATIGNRELHSDLLDDTQTRW